MKPTFTGGVSKRAWVARLAILFCLFAAASRGICADGNALTEFQIKALCLLNFTKYVEWPAGTFAGTNSPIIIGCVGDGKIVDSLKAAAGGKLIGGRTVEVVSTGAEDDWAKCNVLFINATEKKRLPEILKRIKAMPVLTVGESDLFLQQGGVINFLKKDGKIRFEIDVEAARAAHLQISSKLLILADNVQGKL